MGLNHNLSACGGPGLLCRSPLESHVYEFRQEQRLPTLPMCREGLSQCLRECLCLCLGFNKNPGSYSGWAHYWSEGILEDFGEGDRRGWSGAKGPEASSRTAALAGRGLLPGKPIYDPILSSTVSSSSLVAITVYSSPFLSNGLSLYIVPAALAVLYMALKDIWKYLDDLWSSGKKGGFGPLSWPRGFRGGTCFQVLRLQLAFLLLKPHTCASFPGGPLPSHPPGGRHSMPRHFL